MYKQNRKVMLSALIARTSSVGQTLHVRLADSNVLIHCKMKEMERLVKTGIKCGPLGLKAAPAVVSGILMASAYPVTAVAQ